MMVSVLILIDEKHNKPPLHETYQKSLSWAVKLARTENVSGRKGGLAAYKALADDLLVDKDFPYDPAVLKERMIVVFSDAVEIITDGCSYGSQFIKEIAEYKPELADGLHKAIGYCNKIIFLAIQIYI